MRVILEITSANKLFRVLDKKEYSTSLLSEDLCVSARTISDWKRCKYSIPIGSFQRLCDIAEINPRSLQPRFIDEKSLRSKAGQIGGSRYWAKYGTLGDQHSRENGGRKSYMLRSEIKGDIFSRKPIAIPAVDERLAEFFGICMGDGGTTAYQLVISLNSIDDSDYSSYVANLGLELFGVEPRVTYRKKAKCVNLVFSSKSLVDYLISVGLPSGHKIRGGLDIPTWIVQDRDLVKACIRGLFDTDGSIYLEKHTATGRVYAYPRMTFTSASEALVASIYDSLYTLGIEAVARGNKRVVVERFTDIEKYFRIVGSSNQKHLDRFANFGGVG